MSGQPVKPAGAWPMLRALVTVGLVCGLLIVAVYEITAPIIARNRAEALRAAVDDAVPGSATSEERRVGGERVFAAFDEAGGLVGVAIEAQGVGYQDVIKILYGYDPRTRTIIGMVVLESRETPGLGDKIETDAAFRANFEHLDASGPITAVKRGQKTEPYQIDSITGATISSTAIADILRASAEVWVPRLEGFEP